MVETRAELAEVAAWAQGIEAVQARIASRFRRPEPRRRVLDYLKGLVSPIERKNGWQLAEQAGDPIPWPATIGTPTWCGMTCDTM